MRTRFFVVAAFVAVSLVSNLFSQQPSSPEAEKLLQHARTLSSDEYQGRRPGTPGIEKAATYIETQFKSSSLQPKGDNGSYRQAFTMATGVTLGENNGVNFEIRRARPGVPIEKTRPIKSNWKVSIDYDPFGFSESGTAGGRIVFAGYGLDPHGMEYNDYKGIDVKDAIVVVIRGLPKWAEKNEDLRPLASVRSKASVARDKGAKAIIFVRENGDSSDVLDPITLAQMGKNSGIIALQVRRTPCAKIFPPEVPTLFQAEKDIESTKKPKSFEIPNTTVEITTSLNIIESTTHNIVGVVRGSDPTLASQYIVVGAHYDHLGMGGAGSRHSSKDPIIHPGADDNASGTSGLMELAARISVEPTKRSVAFIAFSGEESGLLGSKHWVSTPTVPLSDVVAMVNMDMIGRLDGKLTIGGTGTSPEWEQILADASAGTEIELSKSADGFGPSDHASFTPNKIPVLFFFTGLHTDYHLPSDTYEKLNIDGTATIVNLVERTVRAVGEGSARISFTPGAEQPPANKTSGGFKVSLGVIPDYSDNDAGLRIDGVRKNTPAERGGMKAGDVITKIGSTTVKNIYDLTQFLSSAEPGDVVEVVVLRNGSEKTCSVKLEGRD